MYEDEDFGARGAFGECAYDASVGDDIGLEFARFDIEDEDEYCYGAEDVGALVGEVVLYEAILAGLRQRFSRCWFWTQSLCSPSTVPQVQHQVTHELNVAMFDIDGSPEPPHILCDVVAKHNAAH